MDVLYWVVMPLGLLAVLAVVYWIWAEHYGD